MSKKFGFDLLAEQIGDHARARAEAWCAEVVGSVDTVFLPGESPIERLLFTALFLFLLIDGFIFDFKRGDNVPEEGEDALFCKSQADIEGVGRVDFLFQCRLPGEDKTRSLVVECDGHDFHERTKDQAAKDRARDRAATMLDYQVFRFTGAEIWGDPLGCAWQIVQWAQRKTPR